MSSGHDKAVVVMNLLKPWLSAQDLHKIRPTSLPLSLRCSRGPTPHEELLTVANCWGRESHLLGWCVAIGSVHTRVDGLIPILMHTAPIRLSRL